jgi:hypothetical protein
VTTPTPTKTITFKTATEPTKLAGLVITPGAKATAPEVTPALASALANLTDRDKEAPTATKIISFKTESPEPSISKPTSINVTTPTPSTFSPTPEVAAAIQKLTIAKEVPEVSRVISFKTVAEAAGISAPTSNSLLNSTALEAPKLSADIDNQVQSIMAAANKAAASMAKRTDDSWNSGVTQVLKTDISQKIESAYNKALAAANPVASFNSLLTPQLNSAAAVAKAVVDSITSKSTTVKKQNAADASSAISNFSKIVSDAYKSAKTPSALDDIRQAASAAIDHIITFKSAADKTIDQDHSSLVDSVKNFVSNNLNGSIQKQADVQMSFKVAGKETTPAKALTATGASYLAKQKEIATAKSATRSTIVKVLQVDPNAKVDDIVKATYKAVYGDDPVKAEVLAERYATIRNSLKPYTKANGTLDIGSIQQLTDQLMQKLTIQQATPISSEQAAAQRAEWDKTVSESKETEAKKDKPEKTETLAEKAIRQQPSSTTEMTQQEAIDKFNKESKEAVAGVKPSDVKKSSSKKSTTPATTKTVEFKAPTSLSQIDKTVMYKTKSGNLLPGDMVLAADLPYITGISDVTPPSAAESAAPVSGGNALPGVKATTPTATATKGTISEVKAGTTTNIFGKTIATPTSVNLITFTPVGMTNVKGSDGQRSVKIDTDIYNSLKETGFKDTQIADLLSDGRLGVYLDEKTAAIKIGEVAKNPTNTFTEESGIYRVDPYKAVVDPDTGNFVGVPEWTYYKLGALGVKEADMAKLSPSILNQMKTADTGYLKPTSGISGLPTYAQEALQLPGERQVESGLFVEVPLTAAQRQAQIDATPDPTKDPLGYLLSSAVQRGTDVYNALAKPEYENGYTVQPTVAGLLTFNKIATDLAKPGATINDVKESNGLSSYEMFSAALTNADKSSLEKIAKNNPRLLLGASVDNAIQPLLEAKLGDTYWEGIAAGMSDTEFTSFEKEISKNPNKTMSDTLKGFVESGADGFGEASLIDLQPYAKEQLWQLGKDILISPVTPDPAINTLLAPILAIGKTPIAITKAGLKTGEKIGVISLVKTAQGLNAVRDGKLIGTVIADTTDASKFVVNGLDGSKIDISVKDGVVSASEVKAPSIAPTKATSTIVPSGATKAVTEIVPATSSKATTVDFASLVKDIKTRQPAVATKTIQFKAVAAAPAHGDLANVGDIVKSLYSDDAIAAGKASLGPQPTIVTKEMVEKARKAAEGLPEYVPITSADLGKLTDLGDDVYRSTNGQKYVKYGKDRYLAVSEDYAPKKGDILSVQAVDETGSTSVMRVINPAGDEVHVTYDAGQGIKTIRINAADAVDNDSIMNALQTYEDAFAKGIDVPPGTAAKDIVSAAPTPQDQIKQLEESMQSQLDEINAQLGSEEASSGGGGDGGYSSGGDGSSYASDATSTTDVSQWTMNTDWGAEIRSIDGGKTWQVKDPETGTIYSTTEYEKIATDRIEARRSKYDSETNTYKKQVYNSETKALDTFYQDSAGGWVSKADLDAERAAITAANPSYVYGVDSALGNARTRTLGDKVEYLDLDTGIWLNKDAYTTLKGTTDTAIWSAEGGYYYFKKADGSFEILNPYTNVRQTTEEYAQYIASKNAAAAAATSTPTQLSTYSYPSEYASAYTPSLAASYDASTAAVAAREGGAEATKDAWTAFTQTPDFEKLITSETDLQILAKAKNGQSLTQKEISRAQYLRSQMSEEGKIAFDAATGGETQANLLYQTDFENLMNANRDYIADMSDADIISSGLSPEKEIVVHQIKAEENISKFFATDEFTKATPEAQEIMRAELGYYAGEPSPVSNLLNKFNEIKKGWSFKATEYWNKSVEAIQSSKSLLNEMPDWWKAENANFGMPELALGSNKYSDILVTTKKAPTQLDMEKVYLQNLDEGVVIGGNDGWTATSFTWKNEEGWVTKSPDDIYSFIRKNDLINTADDAMLSSSQPLDIYFWEKPSNVPNNLKIPDDADGSQIVGVTRVDPFSFPDVEWKGITESGGLSSDKTLEYVAIDLVSPSGVKWTTIREANKVKSFTIGKTIDVVEQDAIRIAGKTGKELQAMRAADYRAFIAQNANEIRNLDNLDLPYLSKYLDETRSNLMDDIRVTPVEQIAEEVVSTGKISELGGISPETKAALERKWKSNLDQMDDAQFKESVARNMDEIELTDTSKLGLTPERKALIDAEITDRDLLRSLNSRLDDIEKRISKSNDDLLAGRKTKSEHMAEIEKAIDDRKALASNAEEVKAKFDERFPETEIACSVDGSAGTVATGATLTPLSTVAAAAGAGTVAGIAGMEGMNYKNNLVANFEASQRALHGAAIDAPLPVAAGSWVPPKQQVLAWTARREAELIGEDPNTDWYKEIDRQQKSSKTQYPEYFKDGEYQTALDSAKRDFAVSVQPSTQSNTTAPAAFTSLDQIDRSAEYVTKSGNLYRGADLTEADLQYVVRKAGGQ